MRSKVERVTPAMARRWLEASEGRLTQRAIRKRQVAKLQHAIESGQWRTTHQGLAIGKVDGVDVVLDGQHRLWAIVAADEAVAMLVTRDVDPGIFGTIDLNASRTPADSLKIAGHRNTNVLAAVTRTMIVYGHVAGTTATDWQTRDREVTTADILEWLDDPDHLDAAHAAMVGGSKIAQAVARYGATTPIAAALCVVMTYDTDITPTIRAEFTARLIDGVLLGPRSPILALRRWLVGDHGYVSLSHNQRRISAVSNTLKALNDYALGHERALTVFRVGREPVPLPIPPGAIKRELMRREAEAEAREAAEG